MAALFRYTETEIDPIIQAEILIETARSEARAAILEIVLAIGFGVWFGFGDPVFRGVAIFCILSVLPLLIDGFLRRSAAAKLRGVGPQPQ